MSADEVLTFEQMEDEGEKKEVAFAAQTPQTEEKKPSPVPEPTEFKPKGDFSGIHGAGFRDFQLKSDLTQAIQDCGFEHPSEVQHLCIPNAILGTDVLCQAKSGMGKTAVFVLSILQQLVPKPGQVQVLVVCHARELAFQISHEFERFSKHLKNIKTAVFYGGVPISQNRNLIQTSCPNIVVGTPGRLLQLVQDRELDLSHVSYFVIDECDKVLEKLDMRRDVQMIFRACTGQKQVMMFSATLPKEIRPVCEKFMNKPMKIFVDDQTKLTLHGLMQHYLHLTENQKNRKLTELLDALEFNQVVIFVRSCARAQELDRLLQSCGFPSTSIYSSLPQEDRIARYQRFKAFDTRILVATDLFGRGIDIERVNIVINYDMPDGTDAYLHRVGRAGRFGTKGLAITFVSSEADTKLLNDVQARFEVNITALPEQISVDSYMNA